jgi:hypothetical protein
LPARAQATLDQKRASSAKLPPGDSATARFALANLAPLVFWSAIDGWVRGSLTLYAGR